jgi:uncharacterized protein YndB with AHSA1/START domain
VVLLYATRRLHIISATDRIEKQILLRAPQERVWSAITEAKQFGSWFGIDFEGEFTAGTPIIGRIRPTTVDPGVAKAQERYAGTSVELVVDRIEPMHRFSFRWHPFAIDPDVDYSHEPMTLVTFALKAVTEGTLLTITESGFDSIPLARRADAFEANDEGWAAQATLLEKYLARSKP